MVMKLLSYYHFEKHFQAPLDLKSVTLREKEDKESQFKMMRIQQRV